MDIFRTRLQHGCACINLDFSSFDSSVRVKLIKSAFQILDDIMSLTSVQRAMLKELMEYFINTPLLLKKDIIQKHRGIPSGSAFTQLIGSIVNMIACLYAEERTEGLRISEKHSAWLGDDCCLCVVDHHGISDSVRGEFLLRFAELGLTVNEENTLVSKKHDQDNDRIKFLGLTTSFSERIWSVDEDVDCQ